MSNNIQPVIQKYNIDFASNNNFLFVKGVQGDGYGTRYVDLSFTNYGQPYLINESAVTIVIRGTKPDGNVIFNECEIIDKNTARVEITQQMSAIAGKTDYEISVMSNTENQSLTSFPFSIVISKSSFDVGYVVSSDEFGLLIKKINEVQGLVGRVDDAVNKSNEAIIECENSINNLKKLEGEIIKSEEGRLETEKRMTDAVTNTLNLQKDLIEKRDNGFFNGRDGQDGKDGKDGMNGVITDVLADQIAFYIKDGNLMLVYSDNNPDAQNYSINSNGELIYTFN